MQVGTACKGLQSLAVRKALLRMNHSSPRTPQAAQALGTLWLFLEGGGKGGAAAKASPSSSSSSPSSSSSSSLGDALLAAASDLGAWDALIDTLNRGIDSTDELEDA